MGITLIPKSKKIESFEANVQLWSIVTTALKMLGANTSNIEEFDSPISHSVILDWGLKLESGLEHVISEDWQTFCISNYVFNCQTTVNIDAEMIQSLKSLIKFLKKSKGCTLM